MNSLISRSALVLGLAAITCFAALPPAAAQNLSGVSVKSVKQPQYVVAFYEPVAASDGSRLLCTADGRVVTVPGNKWTQAKRIFHLP